MRKTLIALGLSAALVAPTVAAAATVDDIRREVGEALTAIQSYGADRRDEAVAEAELLRARINLEIVRLEQRLDEQKPEARAKLEQALEEARNQREAVNQELQELKEGSSAAWVEIRDAVSRAITAFRDAYERAEQATQ